MVHPVFTWPQNVKFSSSLAKFQCFKWVTFKLKWKRSPNTDRIKFRRSFEALKKWIAFHLIMLTHEKYFRCKNILNIYTYIPTYTIWTVLEKKYNNKY